MRTPLVLLTLGGLALAALTVAPLVGMEHVGWSDIWTPHSGAAQIFWTLRLPRVCVAFLAGSALAVSGMAFQAMFRNPLAEPFTLGVSSGASLGAAVYIHLGLSLSFAGISGLALFAFGGTLLAVLLVYCITRSKAGFSVATMLLAGVAVSFFFSSLILFLQYLSDFTSSFRMLRWVMGGLEKVVGFDDVLGLAPFVISGVLVLYYLTHELDLLTTGDELAASRGVALERTRSVLFLVTSLMVAAVVAIAGPIGFVGLMVPHICRLLVGPNHRWLTPATVLFGGAFLTACDTLARTLIAPAELPVGIITALLGGPFFLWLLVGRSADDVLA